MLNNLQIAIEESPYGKGVLIYVKKPRIELSLEEFEEFSNQIKILRSKMGIRDENEKRPIEDFFIQNW